VGREQQGEEVKKKPVKSKLVQKKRTRKEPALPPGVRGKGLSPAVVLPTELKEMLVKTTEFLQVGQHPHPYWDIMSAMRGPDYSDINVVVNNVTFRHEAVKEATTGIIRYAAFKNTNLHLGAITPKDRPNYVAIRKQLREDANLGGDQYAHKYHFYWHAQAAFNALGLKWDELNENLD
jgi:hypothetical protein